MANLPESTKKTKQKNTLNSFQYVLNMKYKMYTHSIKNAKLNSSQNDEATKHLELNHPKQINRYMYIYIYVNHLTISIV